VVRPQVYVSCLLWPPVLRTLLRMRRRILHIILPISSSIEAALSWCAQNACLLSPFVACYEYSFECTEEYPEYKERFTPRRRLRPRFRGVPKDACLLSPLATRSTNTPSNAQENSTHNTAHLVVDRGRAFVVWPQVHVSCLVWPPVLRIRLRTDRRKRRILRIYSHLIVDRGRALVVCSQMHVSCLLWPPVLRILLRTDRRITRI